jgi:hypothetical protein
MAENRGHHDGYDHEGEQHIAPVNNPDVKHETADVDVRSIVIFGVGLIVFCVGAFALLVGLFKYFDARETAQQGNPRPGINVDVRRLPPEPRLQAAPISDLQEMRDAEENIIGGYGWVDRSQGVVRIPVDKAMDLLSQRGLPVRATAPPSAASGVSIPTESGLGPIIHQPGGPLAAELAGKPAETPKK